MISNIYIYIYKQFKVILDILGLAHQYGFVELEAAISDYLKEILHIKNVCIIFDAARLYHLEFLMKVSCLSCN